MNHYGEIVKNKIDELDMNKTAIAEKLGMARNTLYRHLDTPNLSLDIILNIGKIIKYDFTNEIPQLKELAKKKKTADELDIDYWRDKYVTLQDDYIALLKAKNDDLLAIIQNMAALVNKISIVAKK